LSFEEAGTMRSKKTRTSSSLLRLEALETRETPAALFATVSPVGSAAQDLIKDASTWATLYTVNPFNGYTGGIQAAIADVNGDGTDDCVIAATGAGGPTNLEMYNGASGALIRTLAVGDTTSRIGVTVTAAGTNATGQDLLAVGVLVAGSSTVEILNAQTGAIVNRILPFGSYSGP